jgi:hypothetical protein
LHPTGSALLTEYAESKEPRLEDLLAQLALDAADLVRVEGFQPAGPVSRGQAKPSETHPQLRWLAGFSHAGNIQESISGIHENHRK